MFSLKFDLLFPSIDAARAAARMLNHRLATPRPPADPRQHWQMLDELRLHREKVKLQSVLHKLHNS
jgi:hypothetical protein